MESHRSFHPKRRRAGLSSKSCSTARRSSALGFVPVSSTLEGVETPADLSYPVISSSISVTFPFSSQFSTRFPEYPGPQLSTSLLKLGPSYLGGQQAGERRIGSELEIAFSVKFGFYGDPHVQQSEQEVIFVLKCDSYTTTYYLGRSF